ncbi:MAG TPA: GTPase ObgE [Candidatus Kaiserbacteria bacterium]|nr:GTPase ObgE [Candidatus Kaiserbacteria bacterium]
MYTVFTTKYVLLSVYMALIDSIRIKVSAGSGGSGIVRWIRERGRPRGGPCGGDGGRGGDVMLEGVRDISALASYRYKKTLSAENGQGGGYNKKHGANGESLVLRVPIGTVARIPELEREIEVMKEGERIVLLSGGAGGFGNDHFKSSTNQNPLEATPGKTGESGIVSLELKLIADAGLIGLPSAGKSSLLNALTHAHAKIGAYPFTTLEPNLGDFYGYILADIPGLIEGASEGKGLGTRFLKHIERTEILIHLVSSEQENPVESYKSIRKELETFESKLSKKREVIVLSKTDLISEKEISERMNMLKEESSSDEVYSVSIQNSESLKTFSDKLAQIFADK